MSSDIAIRVDRLSKLYRIGANEQRHETLVGAVTSFLKSPLQNYRNLRKLSSFGDVKTHGPMDSESQGPSVPASQRPGTAESLRLSVPASQSLPQDVIWALRDVSFEVKHGEVLGLIGRNGAGKSTLLKILARITEPTSGQAEIHGRVGSLLEVGTGFHPDLTGRENVYLNGTILGMKKREVDAKFDQIVDFSGIEKFIDTPVKRYSSGMRVRLAFSVAAHLEPEILLVDEVLAVGDAEFQRKCLGKIGEVASHGRTVLFVSHNMEAILNLCPSCYVLNGGVIAYHGTSDQAVNLYLRSFSKTSHVGPANVLYEAEDELSADQSAKICRLEILDSGRRPKDITSTWDDLIVQIHYLAKQDFLRGTFIVDFFDYKQERLIVLDSGTRIPIKTGRHCVDCRIPRLPLAAGEYFIGAGLAVSNTQWLWRDANLATFQIQGKDVFALGRPPESNRMLFAVDHQWQENNNQ